MFRGHRRYSVRTSLAQAQRREGPLPSQMTHRTMCPRTALLSISRHTPRLTSCPRPSHSAALRCSNPTAFITGTEPLAPGRSAGCPVPFPLHSVSPPQQLGVNHRTKQWEGFLGTAALRGTAVRGDHFQLSEHPDTSPPALCPPPLHHHHTGGLKVGTMPSFSLHCAKNSPAMPAGRYAGWMDGWMLPMRIHPHLSVQRQLTS